VWVCVVLVINSLTLAMGAGTSTIAVNVLFVILAAIWHAVGWVLRRRSSGAGISYKWSASNGLSRTATLVRRSREAMKNMPRVVGRWFYQTGRGGRLTWATFGLPIALAILFPILGPIDFDFVPQVQT